jgi:uncharacterized protein YerC
MNTVMDKTKTSKKWILALNEVKNELNGTNTQTVYQIIQSKKISNLWLPFLRKNNIIILENNFYKWNNKIPITAKLVDKFREYQDEYAKIHIQKRKQRFNVQEYLTKNSQVVELIKQGKTFRQIRLETNKSNSSISKIKTLLESQKTPFIPLPKIEVKQRGGKRENAGRKTKIVEQQKIKVEFSNKPIEKVGIIRRFLRWIY